MSHFQKVDLMQVCGYWYVTRRLISRTAAKRQQGIGVGVESISSLMAGESAPDGDFVCTVYTILLIFSKTAFSMRQVKFLYWDTAGHVQLMIS